MRLHLTIQRHGLPVTRILWTTSPPSLFGHNHPNRSSILPASSSAVTSLRMPNALYGNGGYTIAQLLEDVNEVIPLETEPRLFEDESSGQWGLEDYVVEVGGSECLHFMEIEGILRDGDEVLIRALQISDLKARQISGRHQISADGRHLIDGVPFGKPFLKRPTSSRPAIAIPPRKRRRTAFALWGSGSSYDEEYSEWAPPVPQHASTGKELSMLKPESETGKMNGDMHVYEDAYQDDYEDYHEPNDDGDGTVIRHNIDKMREGTESEDDDDVSASEHGDLSEELQDLKKDMELSGLLTESGKSNAKARCSYSAHPRPSTTQAAPRKSSLSHRSTGRPADGYASRRKSKRVSFDKLKQGLPTAKPQSLVPKVGSTSEELEDSLSSESDSQSGSSMSSSTESEPESASAASSESSSDLESDSSPESSTSESDPEPEEVRKAKPVSKPVHGANPPGTGSERTRKCNRRAKMRRRLTKLKQMGFLDENANFDALREWDSKNRDSNFSFTDPSRKSLKAQEQEEFEAKRRKLLRDLESGGVDVSFVSEKENSSVNLIGIDTSEPPEDHDEHYETANDTTPANTELSKRRSLDVASTRRLLFGSLGVRAPRSKEEEEATRKKLAGKFRESIAQPTKPEQGEQASAKAHEGEPQVDWRKKLILGATECVYDDIKLRAPPFPFEQHWDNEAGDEMRRRRGRNKKRKRRQQLQVGDEAYGNEDYYGDGDQQLNYDDAEQPEAAAEDNDESDETTTRRAACTEDDIPELPNDATSLPDLAINDLRPGLVFAFKQLDVSKATNWQPMVSDYRIAVISEVFDDNILNIQLAKPYRRQPKDADADGAPFSYSGFEMPGVDDDEGVDDGFREVPFDDLIDPKVLRAAPAADAGEKDPASIFPADEVPPAQGPSQSVVDAPAASDGHGDQLVETSSEQAVFPTDKQGCTPGLAPQEDSFARLPQFEAFKSSTMIAIDSDPVCSSYIRDGILGNASLRKHNMQYQLPSTCPPKDSHDLQDTGLTDQLQTISSPVSIGSYHKLMNFSLRQSSKSSRNSSPAEPTSESHSPMVPNPFYETNKAREEWQQRFLPKAQRGQSFDSASSRSRDRSADPGKVDALSSSLEGLRQRTASLPAQEQETSQVSMIPESVQPAIRDRSPTASQIPDSEFIVDLTQSSPPESPGGRDDDFAETQPASAVSISPPRRRRGRRSRS
ncbi:hypothetical protein BDW66DRAFT_160027 [Aspergillus desertorum]